MASEIARMMGRAKGKSEATVEREAFAAPKSDGLIDMKLPKPKKGDKNTLCDAPCSVGDGNRYPYGLELRLDNDVMEKLGSGLPEVGTEVTITAKAHVVSAEARESQDDGKRLSCSLQITKLMVV